MVAAHYDSAALAPGATDNASGTAAVLELGEVFGGGPSPALGIELVAFGADEYGRHGGSLGAAEYVRRHPQEVRQARCVVEADTIDLMSPDGLALAAEVMAALVEHLAGAGLTP